MPRVTVASLCLTTGEHGRSVGAGHVVGLNPDRTDIGGLAAIETHAFVEHTATHGFTLYIVVVAFYERSLLLAHFFGEAFDIFVADSVEVVHAPVLVGTSCLGNLVSLVVALVVHVLAELLVVDFVAVFALYHMELFGEFHLGLALYLDSIVGGLGGAARRSASLTSFISPSTIMIFS